MVTVVAAGATGFLMLTAAWRASEDILAGLRDELARRTGDGEPATIRLAFAPVRTVTCDLFIGDGRAEAGGRAEAAAVASRTTSGAPPYSALFSLTVTAEQLADVAAAVLGRRGFAALAYRATVPLPFVATGRLESASERFLPWLRSCAGSGSVAGLRAAIELAVTEGLATVQLSLPGDPPADLVGTLYDAVLGRAVEVLAPLLAGGAVGPAGGANAEIAVQVELTWDVERPVSARVDMSEVVGPDDVVLPPGVAAAVEAAADPPLRVSLGFDPDDAPLAWIRVQRGDAEAVLEAPKFEAVEVPGRSAVRTVRVTTGYTDGAPVHRQDVPAPGVELVFLPADVGLTVVTVDARALATSGVRSAQVWLTHQPPYGRQVRRVLALGRDEWVAHWWLPAAAGSGPSYLEYRWTATRADGRVAEYPPTRADTPVIVLSFSEGSPDASD